MTPGAPVVLKIGTDEILLTATENAWTATADIQGWGPTTFHLLATSPGSQIRGISVAPRSSGN